MVQSHMKDGFDAFLKIISLHSVSSIEKPNLWCGTLFWMAHENRVEPRLLCALST